MQKKPDASGAHSIQQHTVRLGDVTIPYVLERKAVKNINMRIRPDKGLTVSASPRVSVQQIEHVIQQNAARILQMLQSYEQRQQQQTQQYPLTYTTGETVLYLGRLLRLEVVRGTADEVRPEQTRILLIVSHPADAALRQRTFDSWWRKACARAVGNLCRAVYPIYESRGVAFPQLRFRMMIAQWGNCRPQQGILTFNIRLLAAPARCMEYVVIHEFTHFLYPDHSPAFYRFIEQELPDWKVLQNQLEKMVETRSFRGNAGENETLR